MKNLSKTLPGAVLSIAGSDPSGGAGVQADLKTFSTVGVYGAAAITCLTAQNTQGVDSFLPVDPEFVKKQIELVLKDLPVTHIKTGMIGTGDIAKALGNALRSFSGELVCDPVLRASDGKSLFAGPFLDAYRSELLEKATVLTPNAQELKLISGIPLKKEKDLVKAAAALFARHTRLKAVIVTGGHLEEFDRQNVTDRLYIREANGSLRTELETHPRINTQNSHGTGCTFSSAFAAYHLLYANYTTAFRKTVSFLHNVLIKSRDFKIGHGSHGPLLHHLFSGD